MEKGICSRAGERQPYTRTSALGNILNQRCLQCDIQDSEYPYKYLYTSVRNTDEFYMAHSWSQCPDMSPIMYSHKIRQFDPLRGLNWSLRNYYVISSWPFDPLASHNYEMFQSSKSTSHTPPTFYMVTEIDVCKSQFLILSNWMDCVAWNRPRQEQVASIFLIRYCHAATVYGEMEDLYVRKWRSIYFLMLVTSFFCSFSALVLLIKMSCLFLTT